MDKSASKTAGKSSAVKKRGRPSSPQRSSNKRSPGAPARTSSAAKGSAASKKKEEYSDDAEEESASRETEDFNNEDSRPLSEIGMAKTVVKTKDSDLQAIRGGTFVDVDDDTMGGNGDAQKARPQEVSAQNYNIVIPSYSAWFKYDSINAVEKRAVPEYFTGQNQSKTPEAYMTIRNFIIDSYRLNPTEYLTSTSARRNLTGDVCGIVRIHSFLEQWGLINFQIEAEQRPMGFGPSSTSHFNILLDTPAGVQPLQPPKHQTAEDYVCKMKDVPTLNEEGSLSGDKNEQATDKAVSSNYALKVDGYSKRSTARGKVGREWTEQETLLLLEGLEMYKDDWNKVSEHVGSRTQDECVLHFLKLPIEDPYLEDAKDIGPLVNYPIPFSKTGNPVMTTIAFLASTVDPRIASAAAQAALDKYCKLKEEVPPWLAETHQKAVGEAYDMAKRGEGAMPDEQYGLSTMNVAGLAEGTSGENGDKNGTTSEASTGATEDGATDAEGGGNDSKEDKSDTTSKDWDRLKKMTDKEITKKDLQMAASVALASAAVKAKNLATVEERKIKSLVALLVETQMKKLETKLKHFEELENMIEAEREKLELARQQLIQERQQFHTEQVKAAEVRARLQAQQAFTQQHGPIAVPLAHPAPPPFAPSSAVLQQAAIPPHLMQQQQQQLLQTPTASAPLPSTSAQGVDFSPNSMANASVLSPQSSSMANTNTPMPPAPFQQGSFNAGPSQVRSPLAPQHGQQRSPAMGQQTAGPMMAAAGQQYPAGGAAMMAPQQQPYNPMYVAGPAGQAASTPPQALYQGGAAPPPSPQVPHQPTGQYNPYQQQQQTQQPGAAAGPAPQQGQYHPRPMVAMSQQGQQVPYPPMGQQGRPALPPQNMAASQQYAPPPTNYAPIMPPSQGYAQPQAGPPPAQHMYHPAAPQQQQQQPPQYQQPSQGHPYPGGGPAMENMNRAAAESHGPEESL
ncbi:hypothetical protein RvY_03234 [Ramazzottius varieornatus]|uniref:SWI/SNF complex subunit SMARCC2 n=1 Tax=Ramazzottius varieornatus TaxID=947166 RepID=A0A1D1UMC6_RAMVA|nr:hypothetical protein RvY_03234 [Ramazzottius varieornatus]